MKLHIPPSPRISRIVLTVAIACLLAIFVSVIFVAAQNDDNNPSTAASAQVSNPNTPTKARIAERFGRLPLSFELNKGQIDQRVKFLSHGPGYDLFLTSTDAVLRVQKLAAQPADKLKEQPADATVREGTVLRLKMLGANATPQVEGQDELPGKVNYFIGNDRTKWRRNIPTYRRAYFKDIYPGIDVVYYGTQRELEYDFVVGAGANPKLIRFSVEGAEKIRFDDKAGKLVVGLKHGEVSLNKPVIYQVDENGSRREVKGTYLINGNEVRFKLERFDSSKTLVIDPVLSYSTLLGASNNDSAYGIAVDSQGSAYVTGSTEFTNFPTTPGAFKTTSTNGGAFVTKFDQTGSSLVYSTYLNGNNGSSTGFGIAVDSSGNAYVTGQASGNSFPTVNGLKTTSTFFKTTDAAANWNNQNSGLVGDISAIAIAPNAPATIYAGTSDGIYRSTDNGVTWTKAPATGLSSATFASALAVDPTNASLVYVSTFNGLSKSTDGGNNFSNVSAIPLNFSQVSAIVIDPATPSTMYVAAGNGVFKTTDGGANWIVQNNFGVPGTPNVRALAIDPSAPLTLYAGTFVNGFFKSTNGGGVWTAMNTGMSGPSPNNINAIAIDPANSSTIYVGHGSEGGIDKSTNGATSWSPVNTGVPTGQVNSIAVNSSGVFAAVGNNNGVIKSTNGGTSWDKANAGLWNLFVRFLVAHPSNASILYAATGSTSFSFDAFVTKLNASGSGLLFSTLLGGNNDESGNGIAVDANGNIYVAGQTNSTNFPVANAAQGPPTTNTCSDAFVTKLNPSVPSYVFSTYLRGNQCESALAVALDTSANVYVTGQTSSTDFLILNAFQSAINGFGQDAFVTKLTTDGAVTYSTYLGGGGSETGQAIAADSSGNAYVTGFTSSSNFPTQNAIQPTFGGVGFSGDAFLTKLSSNGSALVFSTFLGGSGSEVARGVALDSSNNVYLTGYTDSVEFPLTQGALRTRSPLFKSIDGAANWSNDNYGFASANVTALVIHPTEPSTIYAGTQSGVFKTTDGGRTWTAINNGLGSNRNVTSMVINPSTPTTLYLTIGGFQSGNGVYKSTDSGATWVLRNTGVTQTDLLSLAIVPSSPNTLYLGVNFCCVVGSHIYKTTDGADNWAPIPNATPLVPVTMVVDPLDHSTLYVADAVFPGAVYKGTNFGSAWQKFDVVVNSPVRWVAVSPHTAGLLFADTDQGVFKSTNGGANWTQIPNRFGKIFFDPVSPSTLYLLSTSFQSPTGIYKSTDSGQTWTAMNKGLNSTSPTALVINPLNPSTLYLTTAPPSSLDAFVTKINAAGSSVVYSTLVGAAPTQNFSQNAQAFAIAVDSSGNAYIAGTTSAPGFAVTPNSFQPFLRGANDAFITKLTNSYIISGRVLNTGNVPLSGAEVVLSDGSSLTSVLTESDGSYQFSRLREGGNYTISANKPHFTMTPSSQTFNNLTSDKVQDFNALTSDSPFFTISGQATENGAGLPGVAVTLSGSQSSLKTTDSNGNYSFELIVGGNYTVTPSLSAFNFAPSSQTFNNLNANQTANFAATRQSFVVTNTNNHGAGSLRDAIMNANATVGTDTIIFNIPGSGVKTISVVIPLPDITDQVVIDGTTQPGYAGTPLIEIDGTALNFSSGDGLAIKAGGTTVRGLSIGNFRAGSGINLNGCDGNVIQGNYIGIAANGTTLRQNSRGIQLNNSSNNVIGGTSAATRNVISGNSGNGIEITSGNANIIQGNFIGTTAAGTAGLSNVAGVAIFNTASINNVIGGTAPGAGNLISGNGTGVSTSGSGTVIQGNLIGTDINGATRIPNSTGVSVFGLNMLVGGATTGARNVISGNNQDGVSIRGAGSKVQGNYIGTDVTGTLAVGNNTGVTASDSVLIGGTAPAERNIIAGNNQTNISLGFFGSGAAVTVQGNYIGADVTGTRALSATSLGISITSSNNIVGGVVAGARNVISGNTIGIQIGNFSSGAFGNVIRGNFIGLNAAGTGQLRNTGQGILIQDAVNNIIGGTQNEAANKIAFNGNTGVTINGNAQGNAIRGNSIFSNTGLGIDLGGNGVTPNDGTDPDNGANNLQNFPVISGVLSSSNSTTIQGSLKSLPNTTFQVDFYSNAAVDPSGNGEGAQFFDTTPVTTNVNGDATINVTFPVGLPSGRVITATATDPNGNTSEFSAADTTIASGSVQFSVGSIGVIEDVGTLPVTVLRTGGSAGTLTVDYATTDGTAIAGQDYTATSGTLTFNAGETSKTIQIPITDDAITEADETFTVSLRKDSNVEVLGAPNLLLVTVQDRNTVPSLSINNVSAVEGNTGTTTEMLFTVSLSAATGRAVSVNYATANSGATGGSKCGNAGVDYETTSGSLSFTPGVASLTVPVKICGDTSAEANELLRVVLTNASGATLGINAGFGTIVDDDVLEMLLEESGPIAGQAAAIDALFAVRDPFRIQGIPDFWPSADRNTRVALFARNLQLNPGELPSAVTVRFSINFGLFAIVAAEDVHPIPNTEFTQVVVRLPTGLPPNTYSVQIAAHTKVSNAGTIRIVP